ncbi:alpha/beta hydrolase [bacterium]|nr:alpha/beta hydrolase [bacterium]
MDKYNEATDRASIDYHYFVRGRLPEWESYIEQFSSQSGDVRQKFSYHADIVYGEHDRHKIDVFPTEKYMQNSPALVFIHGGYWRMLDKSIFSFIAPEFLSAGVAVALVNYRLLPDVGLADIVDDVKTATSWLATNADKFGFDSNKITLCGHSAGAHLAAHAAMDLNANFIGVSGVYDLEPIQNSFLNDIGFLDNETVDIFGANSIMPNGDGSSLFAFGVEEGVEFSRQTLSQVELWKMKSTKVNMLAIDNANHATIVSELANSDSNLFKSSLNLIKQIRS